jgi:glycosyltransferase involved in cell wall biosynthesis
MAAQRKILVGCIPFDGGKSGISVYIREVLRELVASGHDLTLLIEPGAEVFFPGFTCICAPSWSRRPALSMLWHLLILPFLLRRRHFDFFLIAAANRRALAFCPLPVIAVVHDLAQYHIPGKYSRLRMFYLKKLLPFFVRKAAQLVAVSHSTASDLQQHWKVPAERIEVCYNGVSQLPPGEGGWCAKNQLEPGKYILYVSRIEHPGKNHLALLQAFASLPEQLRQQYKLVLAGSDWKDAELVKAAARQSVAAEQIVFTGFVKREDLREAYTQARMYIFPSRFEGFGLSLLEAMACGTPCACSDNSSLGEIGQGAALLFPPENVQQMASAIERLLSDEGLRTELREAGYRKIADYDWKKHVEAILRLAERFCGAVSSAP